MKLDLFFCFVLLTVTHGAFSHMPTVYEFCSHVVANGYVGPPTCDASQCRGRPGKIGPEGRRGISGLKGQKGEEGTSERLEDNIQNLEDTVDSLGGILRGLLVDESAREKVCYMGMKNRQIPNASISSSSSWDERHAGPLGRLDNAVSEGLQGAWCTRQNRIGEWIQVDLGESKLVAGVITQGRPSTHYHQWVTSYKVSCGNASNSLAVIVENGVEKVFSGNEDASTKVVNKFPKPATCRYIRIYPQAYHDHMSMRLEFISGMCHYIY